MTMRASTPSKIHSHSSDDPEPLLAAGLAATCVDGAAAGLCPAGRVTLGIALLTTLLIVPAHPVASRPAARAAPARTRHLVRRRIRAARASLGEKCPASTR